MPVSQPTLFSFFQAKGSIPGASAASEGSAAATAKDDKPKKSKQNEDKKKPSNARQPFVVDTQLSIYWPDDEAWYTAVVIADTSGRCRVRYQDDGREEDLDLSTERYRVVDSEKKKRRRVIAEDSDEEENEFQGDDDDESVFEMNQDSDHEDDDAMEESNWLVHDDEEVEETPRSRRKPTKRLRVVPHQPTTATPTKTKSTMQKTDFSQFAATPPPVTPSTVATTTTKLTPGYTPPPASAAASSRRPNVEKTNGPPQDKSLVYTAGRHLHHYLPFLQNPVDKQGRTPTHPDYDPRTLRICTADWKRLTKKPMTAAVEQWWQTKSDYADTILAFKTGKFYELYHGDADIGVKVLGLTYMKGVIAHAGFPESAFGDRAAKLVAAGYKVARVEQTETPADLAKRKKQRARGQPAPKVVNREVCAVMTAGTRTFCYLQDGNALETPDPASSSVGPLLAVCEVLTESEDTEKMETDDETELPPVCEYGVALIDAIHGTVTLGQFADNVLRSRFQTLLATFRPSEILVESSISGALQSLLQQQRTPEPIIQTIRHSESVPKSTALDPAVRKRLERPSPAKPWDVNETLKELHRCRYYPAASRVRDSATRWPPVLRAAVEGSANLCLASFGAAVYYLQRNLVDAELLSMGVVKAYAPPSCVPSSTSASNGLQAAVLQEHMSQDGEVVGPSSTHTAKGQALPSSPQVSSNGEDAINHMSLDGTTLYNLEILTNSVDHKVSGSLWSKINFTKTPHGARLLRAWLLRPLFRPFDIARRADAVQELALGSGAVAAKEASSILKACGDIERLLSRVHSMSGKVTAGGDEEDDDNVDFHPSERAILYETDKYTKRKVGDFSKLLNGLQCATQIPDVFADMNIQSGLLAKIVHPVSQGGCFPEMSEELNWFFKNFDCREAAEGRFEPSHGVDAAYDDACDTIKRLRGELEDYRKEMCSCVLSPLAEKKWQYVNTKPDSKDKYLIELPASIAVPDDFFMTGKRGKAHTQVNKYRTQVVQKLVDELEEAIDLQAERKARGMKLIFAKFDSKRSLWAAAAQTTSLLDALVSLAQVARKPGYVRPTILECAANDAPSIRVTQGRHPCIEQNMGTSEFIPNDLELGSVGEPHVLLLSGPNMGGKSTLLRQTCLISIMAQIGCFVPATECSLTPLDQIYTRLGASDRLLMGQSTFFVELAETAAALRGATRRSLVIMDELGRGTSTFDGTAIASAAVKHLVERSRCLCLFATHYHSLLDEWKNNPMVKLGHMECVVGDDNDESQGTDCIDEKTITFLYTLGPGACPNSFGINVARLAGLPSDVLANASRVSAEFELQTNGTFQDRVLSAINNEQWDVFRALWEEAQKS